MLVNCEYLEKCASAGAKCNHCKKNKSAKADYYEPFTVPYTPWIPYYVPWYSGEDTVIWCQTTSDGTSELKDHFED